jgi:hypothetical protein
MRLSISFNLRLTGPQHLLLDIRIFNISTDVDTPLITLFQQIFLDEVAIKLADYVVAKVASIITSDRFFNLNHHYGLDELPIPRHYLQLCTIQHLDQRPLILVPISSLTHSTDCEPLVDSQTYTYDRDNSYSSGESLYPMTPDLD